MKILGISGAVFHDPSAALFIVGELVAAVEEERFIRDKHAKNRQALEAVKYCLQYARLQPSDIDAIAYPYSNISLFDPARWHYAARHWYAPDRAIMALFNGNRRYRRNYRNAMAMLQQVGFDTQAIKFIPVEHHLAHAS